MSLIDQVGEHLKDAMRAKDQAKLRTLRAIKAELLLLKTKDANAEVSADDEMAALVKMAKQRRESLKIYQEQGRNDLSQIEEEELRIIETFLPKQLSTDELKAELQKIIEQTGASGIQDMGKVMGMASSKLKGLAEGSAIASAVRELLSA
ncbi:MAG: GatB/YqeY domain-containing protein [Flavobacteriales bacterium]|nr:GatB/YqeY domain-containing protein [Flavobacteriales bacterium]